MKASDIDEARVIELISLCNNAQCDTHEIAVKRGWGSFHGSCPGCYTLGPYSEDDAKYMHVGSRNPYPEPQTHWANVLDLALQLGVPRKVLLAKLRRMIERGTIMGCACGCRGDLIVPGTTIDIEDAALRGSLLN